MSENEDRWAKVAEEMAAAGKMLAEAGEAFAKAVAGFSEAWRASGDYPRRNAYCDVCMRRVNVHPSGIAFTHEGDGATTICFGSDRKLLPNLEVPAEDLGKDGPPLTGLDALAHAYRHSTSAMGPRSEVGSEDPDLYEDGPGDDSAAIVTGGPATAELWALPAGSSVVDNNGVTWEKVGASQVVRYPWHMRDGRGVAPRSSSDLIRTFGPIQAITRPS